MKEEIENNLNNPEALEQLYRRNKNLFTKHFDNIFPVIQSNLVAQCWNHRLHFDEREVSLGQKYELWVVIGLSVLAGLVAKLPDFVGMDADLFYQRNLSFIFFPVLMVYFAWKHQIAMGRIFILMGITLASAVYINVLPLQAASDTFLLASMHLPFLMWASAGLAFAGSKLSDHKVRIAFLRYSGDLVVITTLMLLAGGILSAITIGLFQLINLNIEDFYFRNVAIWGLAAAPLVGTYLMRMNPHLVQHVSPVVSRVFTPLVLIMLVVYLAAMIYTGKNPYTDRDFLLVFNALIVGVLALILFSISGSGAKNLTTFHAILLFALSVVTIVVNSIALSAIVFRIAEWGITPNRLAVLGANVLMLVNLLMVAFQLFKTLKNPQELDQVEKSIALYLPAYGIWVAVVIFIFPILFQFR